MNQKRVAIKTCHLKFAQALSFSSNLSRLIYTGLGSSNTFGRQLGVTEVDGLRALLGVPESWLTPWRQQVLETVYAYTFNLPFKSYPDIWTTEPDWRYTNPNATEATFENSVLDLDYIEAFGLRKSIWEKEILYTQLKNTGPVSYRDVGGRTASGTKAEERNFRLYMALALFGFPDPRQFFRNPDFASR